MLEKVLNYGNKLVKEKIEDENSWIYRMVETSNDQKKYTDIVKRIYLLLYAGLFLGVLWLILTVIRLSWIGVRIVPLIFLLGMIFSIAVFVYSTNFEYFNFWSRKKINVFVPVLYLVMTVVAICSLFFQDFIMPVIFLIPLGPDISKRMVLNLAILLYALFLLVPAGFLFKEIWEAIVSPEYEEQLKAFKIRKYFDFRKNKEFLYDLNIIKRLKDGKSYTIKEVDRQRHMILNGVTGTGKTSSGLVPAVASDLDQKVFNEDYTKVQLIKRIKEYEDIFAKKGLTDDNFHIDEFYACSQEGEEFLKELRKKAPSAGITVIAPNADFADAVYELAKQRGFKVNRVDPIPLDRNTGEMKEGFKGFNPLYISPNLSSFQRKLEIFRKSRMFSDVLQALYEQSGKSDQYFNSLNRNLTTTISILILITYPYLYGGAQPNMTAVQEVINDFSAVRKYLYALAKICGVGAGLTNETQVTYEWLKRQRFGEYQFIVSQISEDLLGPGSIKVEDHARGLRIIINEFLTEPLVRNVMCAKDTVDIDECLKKGEITVVNFAMELGMSIATGFGLFFCLSFNQAVLRRPGDEKSRLLHLYYCDELPVLLHKDMEPIFTLFRQFRVCFTCAFQTSSQFDKNETTKYLKNVVISNCGHHIIYGNCSKDDMQLYETLAGKTFTISEQKTVTEIPISSPDTMKSFSSRFTPQYENTFDGYRIRNKDFQEVTVFGVNGGDHVKPFEGKLSFLTKEQKEGKKRCKIEWSFFTREEEEGTLTFSKTFEHLQLDNRLDLDEMLKQSELSYLLERKEAVATNPDTQDEEIEEKDYMDC